MNKFKYFFIAFFLIFAIGFGIPSFFLFSSLNNHFNNKKIVNNGTICEATPMDFSSNITVNNVKYYSITYSFEVDGSFYAGQTSTQYTIANVQNIFKNNKLEIRYDKNFDSIESDYTFSKGAKQEVIFSSIFAIVDLGFWIVVIVLVVKEIISLCTTKFGKKIEATFGSIKPGFAINGYPYYKISYFWTDSKGNFREDCSGSNYTLDEAKLFESAKTFQILSWKKSSKIFSKPNQLKYKQEKPQTEVIEEQFITCEYCGANYPNNVIKCSNCGAPRKRVNKK